MSLKKEGKMLFLKDVLASKDILFGAFSDKLTKEDKAKEWKKIHERALSFGIVPANKDFTYTRDTYWQNLKKYTVKKIDNRKQTGSGGGPECKLNETDNFIIEILGRHTPLVTGLPSSETWEDIPSAAEDIVQENREENQDNDGVDSNNEIPSTPARVNNPRVKKSLRTSEQDSEMELREKKLKLSIEIMQKESYFKSLQILKLERELGLPPSDFTSMFPAAPQLIFFETNEKA